MSRKAKEVKDQATAEPELVSFLLKNKIPSNSKENEPNTTTLNEPDISVVRPDREGIRKVLGDLEADIMEYIWESVSLTTHGITVRDVYEAFRQTRTIAYTTVMSTMVRLASKNLLRVSKTKTEAAYLYQPNLSKDEFIDNFVSRILENLLISFSKTTQTHLERLVDPQSNQRITELRTKLSDLREAANSNSAATITQLEQTTSDIRRSPKGLPNER